MDNLRKDNSTLFRIVYILKRCIFLICSFKKSYMIITVSVTVIQGIIPALSMIIMQHIINMLQTGSQSISSFMIFIVSYVMLEVIESIISSTYGYYSFKFNEKFDKYVKLLLLQKASSLRLCDFEDAETYNIINRAQNQGGQGILSFFNSFISMLKLFVTASSSLLILSTYKLWMVGIVLIIPIIPIIKYLYSLKLGKEQYKMQIERTSKERESWYITHLILTGNAFKK